MSCIQFFLRTVLYHLYYIFIHIILYHVYIHSSLQANIESATDTVIGAETATATESGTESGTGAAAERGTGTVIVLGAFGGRLDQEIANIHALFKWQGTFRNIVLLGKECSFFYESPTDKLIW
jgi:thiamine pyrophosphokinase